jgi:RNA polymerase sigma-70 factor (ECF subfamily)
LLRPDLCTEAIRLARLLATLMPSQAEALGLLALLLFQDSRRNSRTNADGELILLEEQDRTLWDRAFIIEATALLDSAMLKRQTGPYQIQAAIAALHANARTAADTDWRQISALYGALLRHMATPVVELNAAVALAMATTLDAGLAWVDQIAAAGALDDYHLLHAARADLLRRAGRAKESRAAYDRALALVKNTAEREYLLRRRREISSAIA